MRWRKRPEGSNWGAFGADDVLGRLNLLTAERVRRAAAEIHTGQSFCLSLPLDYPGGNVINPRRFPPRLQPTIRDGRPNYLFAMSHYDAAHTDIVCDDAALLHLQYSTQWDSFAHFGAQFDADDDGVAEIVFYNGYRGGSDIRPLADPASGDAGGAGPLGIESMAVQGLQGRGVMVDLHAHFGRANRAVGHRDLMGVLAADGVQVEEGDMLCLHTGFADVLLEMGGKPAPNMQETTCCTLDGRDRDLLRWISDSGIAVLVADNYAVERLPSHPASGPCAAAPIHEHCLFKLGLPLGELWELGPLARWLRANGRYRFFLTAPPLRLPGAVGSPATPIATV